MSLIRYYCPELLLVFLGVLLPSAFLNASQLLFTYVTNNMLGIEFNRTTNSLGFLWLSLSYYVAINFLRIWIVGRNHPTRIALLDTRDSISGLLKRLLWPSLIIIAFVVNLYLIMQESSALGQQYNNEVGRFRLAFELISIWVIGLVIVEIILITGSLANNLLREER